MFLNMLISETRSLWPLAAGGPPQSAVRDYVFVTFASTVHIWRTSFGTALSARTPHQYWQEILSIYKFIIPLIVEYPKAMFIISWKVNHVYYFTTSLSKEIPSVIWYTTSYIIYFTSRACYEWGNIMPRVCSRRTQSWRHTARVSA